MHFVSPVVVFQPGLVSKSKAPFIGDSYQAALFCFNRFTYERKISKLPEFKKKTTWYTLINNNNNKNQFTGSNWYIKLKSKIILFTNKIFEIFELTCRNSKTETFR